MNPPQNINNHFSQPLKAEDRQVSPMCCCYYTFTERGFYKFINIWDLIFACLGLLGGKIPQIIMSVLFFIFVLICLIKFCNNGDYGTGFHKAYAIIRLVFVFLELIFIIIFSVLCIVTLSKLDSNHEAYGPVLTVLITYAAILLPITIVSIQWSFLLKNVINNKIEAANGGGFGMQQPNQEPQYGNQNQFPQPGVNSGFNPGDSNYVN